MKTTIEISDALLDAARQLAQAEGTTLRALVEAGLLQVLAERRTGPASFRLRKASVKGEGLIDELQGAPWDSVLDLGYRGRGAC